MSSQDEYLKYDSSIVFIYVPGDVLQYRSIKSEEVSSK